MRKNLILSLLLIVAVIFAYNCTSSSEATIEINWHIGGKTKAAATPIDEHIYADPAAVSGSSTEAANFTDPDLMHAGWFTFTIDAADIGNILNFVIKDSSSPISIALFNSSDNLVSLYQYDSANSGCDAVFGLVDQGTVYLWIGPENDTPGQDVSTDITFKLSTGTYKGPSNVTVDAVIDYDSTKTPAADTASFKGARFYLFNPFDPYYGGRISPQTVASMTTTNGTTWSFSMPYAFDKGGTYEMTAVIAAGQISGNDTIGEGSLFYGNATETNFDPIKGCFVLDAFDVKGGTTGYDFEAEASFTLSQLVYQTYVQTYPTFTNSSTLDFHEIPKGLLNAVIDTTSNNGVVKAGAGITYDFTVGYTPTAAVGKGFVTMTRKDTSYTLAQLAKMYPGKVRLSRTVGLR